MNIGFIGAGRIANTLASTMARMEDVNLYAVAARDLDRAQAFAAQYGFDKAYNSSTISGSQFHFVIGQQF